MNFQSANQAGFERIQDSKVLSIAASDGRVLVTHDRRTMPTEFGEFIVSQRSAGVLVLSQSLPIGEAINALVMIWEASTAEEWVDQIMTFPF